MGQKLFPGSEENTACQASKPTTNPSSSRTCTENDRHCTGQGSEGNSTPFGLSLRCTSQGRGAGQPDQTVAGPFAELDGSYAVQLQHVVSYRQGWGEGAWGSSLAELASKALFPISGHSSP